MSEAPEPTAAGAAASDADKRKEVRAPIELRVEYRRLNSFFADFTRNISRGGTFIRTARPLDVGTEFRFELILPAAPGQLSLLGVVRWVIPPADAGPGRDAGMGIEFVFRDPSERDAIHQAVEAMMKRSLGEQLYAKLLGDQP